MAWKMVPLQSWPDQEILTTVEVSGVNIPLRLRVRWNFTYEFWFMSVSDGITGQMLLDGVPLVTGDYPAADLLAQYQYLGIGSAVIVSATEHPPTDAPTLDSLGVEFLLMWGDGEV